MVLETGQSIQIRIKHQSWKEDDKGKSKNSESRFSDNKFSLSLASKRKEFKRQDVFTLDNLVAWLVTTGPIIENLTIYVDEGTGENNVTCCY